MTPAVDRKREVAIDAYVATLRHGTITEEWALELVMLRLRRHAWGGPEFHITDQGASSQALAALERLVEMREEHVVAMQVYREWEHAEQMRKYDPAFRTRVAQLETTYPALAVWALNTVEAERTKPINRAAAWEVMALVCEARGDMVGAAKARVEVERALPPVEGGPTE